MCLECGCSETTPFTIDGKRVSGHHHHDHHHNDGHTHGHHHSRDPAEGNVPREISIRQDILHQNNHIARHNREHLAEKGVFAMNWISAPGSGKTALLERLIRDYGESLPIFVIEGDQQTDNDARRIHEAGADAMQINTGAACHLDAAMIHQALHHAKLSDRSLLVIENVGNMVCPTAYDLGENLKVALISTPEGEDKPAKYPDLVLAADVLVINKTDLIPHLDFDLEQCIASAKQVNPGIAIFPLSARTGEGVPQFCQWIRETAGF